MASCSLGWAGISGQPCSTPALQAEPPEQAPRPLPQLHFHPVCLGPLAVTDELERAVLELGNPVTPRLDQPRDPDLAGNRLPVARPDDWETADLLEDLPTGEQDERGQMGTDLPAGDAASVEEDLVGVKRMDRLPPWGRGRPAGPRR